MRRPWFDKLTTNGVSKRMKSFPFVLSLSKDEQS
jgi:hypothetical protein